MLRMVRNVFFGASKPIWARLNDAEGFSVRLPYGLLVAFLLIFGLWPSLLLDVIKPTTEDLIKTHTQVFERAVE